MTHGMNAIFHCAKMIMVCGVYHLYPIVVSWWFIHDCIYSNNVNINLGHLPSVI